VKWPPKEAANAAFFEREKTFKVKKTPSADRTFQKGGKKATEKKKKQTTKNAGNAVEPWKQVKNAGTKYQRWGGRASGKKSWEKRAHG